MPGPTPDDKDLTADTTEKVEAAETEVKDAQDPAESSPAEDKGEKSEPKDVLTAVKAALDKGKEKAPASDEPGSKSDEPDPKAAEKEGGEGEGEADDLTEEELARLRPKTRKRIDNLLRDRASRDQQIAELQPKAERFDKITQFVEEAELTKDEVNQGFAVMRDLKSNPLVAYQTLKPIMEKLEEIVGNVLPDDLKQAVNRGEITEALARDVARGRSHTAISQQREQREQQRRDEQRQREDHQKTVDTVAGKVNEWESSKAKADPSWKLKQPLVQEKMEAEILRRQRANPQYFPSESDAVDIAEKALDAVNKQFAAFAPKKKAIQPGPDAGSSPHAAPKPTSMLEAARQGLNRARAG